MKNDTSRTYAYLRASTAEQDAQRAKGAIEKFAAENGLAIAGWFTENVSGASLQRPELFRLLSIAQPGDVLLVEQIDRLSRLNSEDWETLREMIRAKRVRIVALDLPTSCLNLKAGSDDFMRSMMDAINGMMLDMLAAMAHKDYLDRKRRQAEGVARAKALGKYRGRPADTERHENIRLLIKQGMSQGKVAKMLGCSVGTVKNALKSKDRLIE